MGWLVPGGTNSRLRGRRIVVVTAAVVGLGLTTVFFNSSGLWFWPLAFTAITLASGLLPALGVYRGEMFPTAVELALQQSLERLESSEVRLDRPLGGCGFVGALLGRL